MTKLTLLHTKIYSFNFTIFFQVLKGDIKPAVETHEMLYQVMQRHNFIPEAFTTDFQVLSVLRLNGQI